MHVNGKKVAKEATRKRIIEALQPGWRLVRVNWKKLTVHVADLHGRVKVIPLYRT
jgi:hypothetical protein